MFFIKVASKAGFIIFQFVGSQKPVFPLWSVVVLTLAALLFSEVSYGELCSSGSPAGKVDGQIQELSSGAALWQKMAPCIGATARGVWNSREQLKNSPRCLLSPFQCISQMSQGFKDSYAAIKEFVQQNPIQVLSSLPPGTIHSMVCEISGSVFTDATLAVLTGGATSGVFAMSLQKMSTWFALLPRLSQAARAAKSSLEKIIKNLRGLSREQLAKLHGILQRSDGEAKFQKALLTCSI